METSKKVSTLGCGKVKIGEPIFCETDIPCISSMFCKTLKVNSISDSPQTSKNVYNNIKQVKQAGLTVVALGHWFTPRHPQIEQELCVENKA